VANGPKEKFPHPVHPAPQVPGRKGVSLHDNALRDLPHAPQVPARKGFVPNDRDPHQVPPAPQVPPSPA
jgi:hypothetical protein